MLRILLSDDHALIRKGLRQILLEEYPSCIIEETSDAESAIKRTLAAQYHIVISDLSMPGRSGLDLVEHMKKNFPKVPVLILSMYLEEQYAIRVLKAGAAGYLGKDSATGELIKAVHKLLQGRKYISPSLAQKNTFDLGMDNNSRPHEVLSNREIDVFRFITKGKSLTDIAGQLTLSLTTISTYRARILLKMNMKTNAELIRYSIENKLV